jgi:6-phosphofructokinase 1
MKVGVLTGGGDCPGLNAVIRAVTRCLIRQCNAEVIGIEDGFAGLLDMRTRPLAWQDVGQLLALGGTILGTSSRIDPMRDEATVQRTLDNARQLGLDAVVAIGGDGTMTIAHGLAERGLKVVGVPKTIDNDIEGCERSFGFDTAMATATDALERVHTTGQSHGRVMILETMGRNAGWIALEAGIAGAADVILLPEIEYDIEAVAEVCRRRESFEHFTLICIGEGAKARGGQLRYDTPPPSDHSKPRLGGVAFELRDQLQPLIHSEVRATVLGHLQRGGSPTPFDRVLATQFGVHAAELVLKGDFNKMVTLRGGALASLPLHRVAGQNRHVTDQDPMMQTARALGICLGEPT